MLAKFLFVLSRDTQIFTGITVGTDIDADFTLCREHLKTHSRAHRVRGISARSRVLESCDTCVHGSPYIP